MIPALTAALGGMGIIQFLVLFVIVLIVVGFVYWAVKNYAPEPVQKWAVLIIVLVVVIFLIWLLLTISGQGSGLHL